MKKNLTHKITALSWLVISTVSSVFAQGFQKHYTAGFAKGTSIISDSISYVIAGTTTAGKGKNDILLMKTDLNGTVTWTKAIGGKGNDIANRIKKTSDKGYIIVGSTTSYLNPSNPEDSSNVYIVKTDANGIIQWTKTISFGANEVANDVIEKKNHTYAIVGNTTSKGITNAFLVCLNASGTLIHTNGLGFTKLTTGNGVIETNNSEVCIVGATLPFGTNDELPYIMKIDTNGYYQKGSIYTPNTTPSKRKSFFTKINWGYDGQLIITGFEGIGSFPGFDDAQELLVCIDTTFKVKWAKSYGLNSGQSIGTAVEKTFNSGFIISGTMGVNIPALITTDSVGKGISSRIYPGILNDIRGQGWDIKSTFDGKYAFIGSRFEKTDTSVYLIETDAFLYTDCLQEDRPIDEKTLNLQEKQLYFPMTLPIPYVASDSGSVKELQPITHICAITGIENETASDEQLILKQSNTSIEFELTSTSDAVQQISIYNLIGACIKTIDVRNTKQISTSAFSAGIYIYRIVTRDHKVFNGKIEIQ
jgi:hypothetical protein